jgi:hypothetical protein
MRLPSPGAGGRQPDRASISGPFPDSFAETPSGLVLIANGVDPMLRWGSPWPIGTGIPMQFNGRL